METKQFTFIDKRNWGAGEWQSEPDKIQWEDPTTKLPCVAKRNYSGAWCGYVGVPPNHPYWHDQYGADLGLDVHGGLTYANFCAGEEDTGICHTPAPGEPPNVWWLGFDCAHGGDMMPNPEMDYPGQYGASYRNLVYVQQQCEQLAAQLFAVK